MDNRKQAGAELAAMTPRPPFTIRELRRLQLALGLAIRDRETVMSGDNKYDAQAARDAAAFARLRAKVMEMVEGREDKR